MSSPDFPDGTGPIATTTGATGETTKLDTNPRGTGPIAVPAPIPAPPKPSESGSGSGSGSESGSGSGPFDSGVADAPPTLRTNGTPAPTSVPGASGAVPATKDAATKASAPATPPAPSSAPSPATSPASAPSSAPSPAASPAPAPSTPSYPLNGGRQRPKALALARLSPAELERAFQRGVTPDAQGLVGWEFRGNNTPPWFRLLGIQKFVKGFYTDGDGGVWGYNSPVVQDGVDRPWRIKPSDEQPKRFGFYTVRPVDATARDNRYLHALLLDYGQGDNPRLDPSAGLRDYLVQVDRDDPDLLLGKAYYALGPLRLPTFSFFVLDRHRPGPHELARRAR